MSLNNMQILFNETEAIVVVNYNKGGQIGFITEEIQFNEIQDFLPDPFPMNIDLTPDKEEEYNNALYYGITIFEQS